METRFEVKEFNGKLFCFQSVKLGNDSVWLWLGERSSEQNDHELSLWSTSFQLWRPGAERSFCATDPILLLPFSGESRRRDVCLRISSYLSKAAEKNILLSLALREEWLIEIYNDTESLVDEWSSDNVPDSMLQQDHPVSLETNFISFVKSNFLEMLA
ncbi:hypothetical protein F1559_000938 [Cyanidiococcus yangmingshanensis]|uniref:Uncharacterized protein n=1 Tax=Cyanidiococcus yangmingshanensis TaxID=2690220 RepID=A0A7J7IKE3_9RHOD|nr:hypothetical protein F1559_000938 [Cyanidiococcus yangmingshanensis]